MITKLIAEHSLDGDPGQGFKVSAKCAACSEYIGRTGPFIRVYDPFTQEPTPFVFCLFGCSPGWFQDHSVYTGTRENECSAPGCACRIRNKLTDKFKRRLARGHVKGPSETQFIKLLGFKTL